MKLLIKLYEIGCKTEWISIYLSYVAIFRHYHMIFFGAPDTRYHFSTESPEVRPASRKEERIRRPQLCKPMDPAASTRASWSSSNTGSSIVSQDMSRWSHDLSTDYNNSTYKNIPYLETWTMMVKHGKTIYNISLYNFIYKGHSPSLCTTNITNALKGTEHIQSYVWNLPMISRWFRCLRWKRQKPPLWTAPNTVANLFEKHSKWR